MQKATAITAALLISMVTTYGQQITGVNLRATQVPEKRTLETRLIAFQTKPATTEVLEALANCIVQHYQAAGRPVVLVSVEPELAADGSVQVVITDASIANAKLTGGMHLAKTPYQNAVADLQGKLLNGVDTQSVLDFIQRNPFASTTSLTASPGLDFTSVDLSFQLPDTPTSLSTLSFANDGVAPLGSARWRAETRWGNVLGTGQWLQAELSSSEDGKSYLSETLSWTIPLSWQHEMSFTASHASTQADLQVGGQDVNVGGDAWQCSLRYTIPWRSSLAWKHRVYGGLDYKNFDTDLSFGGLGTFSQPLETMDLVAGTSTSFNKAAWTGGSLMEVSFSPGDLFSHDADSDYASVVADADSRYLILRAGMWSRFETQNKWVLQARVSGQWADGPLLPAEEASLTGMSAVRGYPERSLLGKHAVWGALEAFSPSFQLPGTPSISSRCVAFTDAGQAWASDADEPNANVLSAGVGIHADRKKCRLRCEIAWPLQGDHSPRLHAMASISF